jgi:hypothetical protein
MTPRAYTRLCAGSADSLDPRGAEGTGRMIALTPQFILLTTGVGVLMILVGLGRGPAPGSQHGPPLSVVWSSDRRSRVPNLHQEGPLIPLMGTAICADSGFRYLVVSVPVF